MAESEGPEAGLAVLDGLDGALPLSHRVPAVRAELLRRTGDSDGARTAYGIAIARCTNEAERTLLTRHRNALDAVPGDPVESPGDRDP